MDPDIDMVLKGKAVDGTRPGTYALRLAAVRELARWQYRLIDGSSWTDDCEKCGRPTIRWSLHGGFDLVLVEKHPLFNRYHLFDIRFFSGTDYELEGEGDYQAGGEVALRQELRLDVEAKGTFGGPRTMTLTNMPGPPTRLWPMWAVDVQEAESTPESKLLLELRAAPVRELWFSTTYGTTAGCNPASNPAYRAADVDPLRPPGEDKRSVDLRPGMDGAEGSPRGGRPDDRSRGRGPAPVQRGQD